MISGDDLGRRRRCGRCPVAEGAAAEGPRPWSVSQPDRSGPIGTMPVGLMSRSELPEPPRNGEDGPDDCWTCASSRGEVVWEEERWLLSMSLEPQSVPGLHIFLVARPAGMIQLKGMYLSTWMFALPALPAEDWDAMRRQVAAGLGTVL